MNKTVTINPDIQLTPPASTDIPVLVKYLNDPIAYRNTLNIPSPYTASDAQWWLDHNAKLVSEIGEVPNWLIRHKEFGTIGGIGCFYRSGKDGHSDEIGYWLAEPYRGRGLMSTVVEGYSQYLFDARPGLVRIEAVVFHFNFPSARVLEKAGFTREGYLRKARKKQDEFIDVILMAKIRE